MNFVYIHTHDTGRYISPYGHSLPTPNLMKIAQNGVIFRQAYCAGPTCSPSRAALLTGQYPHQNGMTGLAHRGFELNDYSKHLVSYLKKHGYYTILSGVQHETDDQSKLGYDEILTTDKYKRNTHSIEYDLENVNAVVEKLKECAQNADKPFFLSFGIYNTHRPYPKNDEFDENYIAPPHSIADNTENRGDYGDFLKSVSVADECVGMVWDVLFKTGLINNTIVMFTTDHGLAMPRMKCTLYDAGIGVSLIFAGAGIPKHKCCNSLISHIDIYPTICDLLNIKKPDWLSGKSAVDMMYNDNPIRDYVFSEINYHVAYQPSRCIRNNKYKLIKNFYDTEKRVFINIDDSHPKEEWIGSANNTSPLQLFDLTCDPEERHNLAYLPQYSDILNEMLEKLESWMKQTNDPLCHGDVPINKDAVIYSQNDIYKNSTKS